MRSWFLVLLLGASAALWAQDSPQSSKTQDSSSNASRTTSTNPNLEPPRSDTVNVRDLGNESGDSSSKNTQIDLSPPADDAKAHSKSSDVLEDVEGQPGSGDVNEMHPWNPHKAAKDVEVGDYYFKRKNYVGAESRYREALYYKDNDAIATYRLAVCLEKMGRPEEAVEEFESYLRILPHGPQAEDARKAIERLKTAPTAKAAK
ncbi:MAG TPA: tetratricopeptide repeat protein [Candidatus Sulfotelmatobacter sp.]|nr:tetratricopeptide repeat protein [Candidatus Sulfotelmatobacter sp.]